MVSYYQPMGVPAPNLVQNYVPGPTTTAQQVSNIFWVKGIEGAKNFENYVPVVLLNSEDTDFYIKAFDETKKPTLRSFHYTETTPGSQATVVPSNEDYVQKKDFEAFRDEVRAFLKGVSIRNESTIPTAGQQYAQPAQPIQPIQPVTPTVQHVPAVSQF